MGCGRKQRGGEAEGGGVVSNNSEGADGADGVDGVGGSVAKVCMEECGEQGQV